MESAGAMLQEPEESAISAIHLPGFQAAHTGPGLRNSQGDANLKSKGIRGLSRGEQWVTG